MQFSCSVNPFILGNVLVDPVDKDGGLGVDTGVSLEGAAAAPGDDSAVGVVGLVVGVAQADVGAAGVTLAGVVALLAGADHVVGDAGAAVVGLALCNQIETGVKLTVC